MHRAFGLTRRHDEIGPTDEHSRCIGAGARMQAEPDMSSRLDSGILIPAPTCRMQNAEPKHTIWPVKRAA
jgi:hypothetical protein